MTNWMQKASQSQASCSGNRLVCDIVDEMRCAQKHWVLLSLFFWWIQMCFVKWKHSGEVGRTSQGAFGDHTSRAGSSWGHCCRRGGLGCRGLSWGRDSLWGAARGEGSQPSLRPAEILAAEKEVAQGLLDAKEQAQRGGTELQQLEAELQKASEEDSRLKASLLYPFPRARSREPQPAPGGESSFTLENVLGGAGLVV